MMASHPQQGGAQALPIAVAFVATGGKLMLNQRGEIETGANLTRIFGAEVQPREARRAFVIARRLHRRLRNASFARSIKCLVLQEGERTDGGWVVMGGRLT